LAASLDTLRGLKQNWSGKIRMWVPKAAIMVLIGWNLGFIFQWGGEPHFQPWSHLLEKGGL
jgi:hypothetical protein